MFVTFDARDGSDPVTWDFDPDDVTRKQGETIETAMGQVGNSPVSFETWLQLVQAGNMKARAILLWHLLRLTHPNLPFKDVPDFARKQLKVEMSVAELRALKDKISRVRMDDQTREIFEAQFDRDIADAMQRETGVIEGDIEPVGKAN